MHLALALALALGPHRLDNAESNIEPVIAGRFSDSFTVPTRTVGLQEIKRPRENWVFRSVLDSRARIVTCALHNDFWIAYDATNCGLYKAWKGTVNFDGAVYTSSHGPQPTSQGEAFFNGIVDSPVWFLTSKAGANLPIRALYRGYRLVCGQVEFHYELKSNGQVISVYETPEVVLKAANLAGVDRKFRIKGLGEGQRLRHKLSTSLARNQYDVVFPTGSPLSYDDDKTTSTLSFLGEEGKEVGSTIRVNFPASSGAPGLSLNLDDAAEDFGTESSDSSTQTHKAPAGSNEIAQATPKSDEILEPGLAYRAYQIDSSLSKIPKLIPNQTPNVNKTVLNVNFRSSADFELKDKFYAELTGYLRIAKPGLFFFRLSSDDGSRLMLRGESVIENDGLGSGDWKEGSLDLKEGLHALRIEFFDNEFDEKLVLEWKRPGDAAWSLVPSEVLGTPAGEVHVTSPGNKKVLDALWLPTPGDGVPLTSVHPSYTLSTPRPDGFTPRVGGMDFLPDGRLVLCTWDPDGAVYLLSGVETGDKSKVKEKRIALGLAEPLGVKVVGKDIYVLQKQELTKLVDHDGDEIIDEYYALANGWGVTPNFHEFAFGLVYKDGFFYGALATAINPGGSSTRPQNPDRGRTIKISAKDGSFEFVAAGLRTPNGIGLGYKNEIFITDNQGDWLPSSKLLHLKKGAFYGNRSVDPDGTKNVKDMLPVVWLPQGEIGNSPSQPTSLLDGRYKGQMIHGDVTHGGLKRVFVENVGGQLQGTVFRFTQGLEAGINRVVNGPDGAIYVGGIGSTGNWGQDGKERFGLQRLKFNGATAFEVLEVRPMKNGAELVFTEPLAAGDGENLNDYFVQRWRYVPTEQYGGPKVDETKLPVKSVTLSKDRKRVFVEFDGVQADRVLYIKIGSDVGSASGKSLWTTESWSTVNIVPNRVGKAGPYAGRPKANGLSVAEATAGFKPLFNGSDTSGWKAYNGTTVGKGWQVVDDALTYIPGSGGGDIATIEKFGDFEFRFEWKVAPGANSGVMYRVTEGNQPPWWTGVEYQILDNLKHPDGRNPKTSAASSYGLLAPSADATRKAGVWNKGMIIARGTKVEHWLNGVLVVSYDSDSQVWRDILKTGKFATSPMYSKNKSGAIVLQDHGDLVAYRNLRIRKL